MMSSSPDKNRKKGHYYRKTYLQILQFLENKLFYHNSYLPAKLKDWEIYNEILIQDILDSLYPSRKHFRDRLVKKEEIVKLRHQGWTLQKIGDKYGLSRERIRQLLKNKRNV